MNTVNITTPQNIQLSYDLGSLGDRVVATIIDYLLMTAYVLLLVFIFYFTNSGPGGFVYIIIILALPIVFYHLLCETLLNGQSFGKRFRDIKVISLSGQQPSFSQYLLRWLFRLVDFSITSNVLGLVLVAATDKHQRLGDIVAGTVVVKVKPRTTAEDTWFEESEANNYQVTYPEVTALHDSDIQLLKDVIQNVKRSRNQRLLLEAQFKIEDTLHIRSKETHAAVFLYKIITDYNYLTSQL